MRNRSIGGLRSGRGYAATRYFALSTTCIHSAIRGRGELERDPSNKPGPKLILQIQVTDGVGTEDQFENAIKLLTERTPVEGIGEKAYFIPRTEPPIGTRLYCFAKGVMVLVNIGREDLPMGDLEATARDLSSEIIASI